MLPRALYMSHALHARGKCLLALWFSPRQQIPSAQFPVSMEWLPRPVKQSDIMGAQHPGQRKLVSMEKGLQLALSRWQCYALRSVCLCPHL